MPRYKFEMQLARDDLPPVAALIQDHPNSDFASNTSSNIFSNCIDTDISSLMKDTGHILLPVRNEELGINKTGTTVTAWPVLRRGALMKRTIDNSDLSCKLMSSALREHYVTCIGVIAKNPL